MSKTILFQAIQFSISTQFSSILPIDRNLTGATTPGQSGPGSKGNEGILRIPQCSSITRTSPADCLLWCPEHSLGRWVLLFCIEAVGVFYSSSLLSMLVHDYIYIYIYIYIYSYNKGVFKKISSFTHIEIFNAYIMYIRKYY